MEETTKEDLDLMRKLIRSGDDQWELQREALVELKRIRFRVGVCALILSLPFILGLIVLFLVYLGMSV